MAKSEGPSGQARGQAAGAGGTPDGLRQFERAFQELMQSVMALRDRPYAPSQLPDGYGLLYRRMDAVLDTWCRRREIRTEPFNVFRYGGAERGPTQHETAIGPSLPFVERAFDRLAAAVPEIVDSRRAVVKAGTKAIAPGFRLQHPLPFGAAGEVVYDGSRADLDRAIYQVAMYAATSGDPSRGWRYDCGLLVFYGADPPRPLLGEPLWEAWPEVQARVWESGRVWTILL